MALANTEALRAPPCRKTSLCGRGPRNPRSEGRLTGIFKDAAMELVSRAMPPLSADGILTRARAALKHAAGSA